jgi:general secretion pathway protein A
MVDEPIFTRGALRKIIKHARGTPRVINILCTNALIQGFGYHKRRISTKIITEVIADYTGKKPPRLGRSLMALAGMTVLLGALFWFSPYREVVLAKISLTRVRQFMTPSVVPPLSPPQATPAAEGESLLPASSSTPALPMHPPQLAFPSPGPEASELSLTVPATVRTVKRGDQITKVALEVYGSSHSTVLDWIRKNNPHLRDLNRIEVGTSLTLPPLPPVVR